MGRAAALCSFVMKELLAPELDSHILISYIMQDKDMHFSVRRGLLHLEHMLHLLLQSFFEVLLHRKNSK